MYSIHGVNDEGRRDMICEGNIVQSAKTKTCPIEEMLKEPCREKATPISA